MILKTKHKVKIKISSESIYFFAFSKIKQKNNNKITHSLLGNIQGVKQLKLMQINKGSALF